MRRRPSITSVVAPCVGAIALSLLAGTSGAGSPHHMAPLLTAPRPQPVEFDLHTMENMLQSQGYQVVSVDVTFLGRLRFVARNEYVTREVVVSRTTGAILRDVVSANPNRPGQPRTGATGSVSQTNSANAINSGGSPGGGTVGQTTGRVRNTVTDTVDTVSDALGL